MTILQYFENAGDTMAAPAEVEVAGGQKILQPIEICFLPIFIDLIFLLLLNISF